MKIKIIVSFLLSVLILSSCASGDDSSLVSNQITDSKDTSAMDSSVEESSDAGLTETESSKGNTSPDESSEIIDDSSISKSEDTSEVESNAYEESKDINKLLEGKGPVVYVINQNLKHTPEFPNKGIQLTGIAGILKDNDEKYFDIQTSLFCFEMNYYSPLSSQDSSALEKTEFEKNFKYNGMTLDECKADREFYENEVLPVFKKGFSNWIKDIMEETGLTVVVGEDTLDFFAFGTLEQLYKFEAPNGTSWLIYVCDPSLAGYTGETVVYEYVSKDGNVSLILMEDAQ